MAKKCKARLKSIYEIGGQLPTATTLPYGQMGQMAGATVEQINPESGAAVIGGGALKGAGTGAAMGSVVPGIGTAVGAGVGAVVGGIGGVLKNKKNKEAAAAQQQLINQQNIQNSLQNFQQANSMYKNGGSLNNKGDITEYNGYPHELGGINIGPDAEVETGETRGVANTKDYVFSDTLSPDGSKKTFADVSKEINKKYKGYENDKFALASKDKELSELMFEQESLKQSNPQTMNNNKLQFGGPLNLEQIPPVGGEPVVPPQTLQPKLDATLPTSQQIDMGRVSNIPTTPPSFDDEQLRPFITTQGYEKWPTFIKEDALRQFKSLESSRENRLNEFAKSSGGVNPLQIKDYDDILTKEGTDVAQQIANQAQERYNQAIKGNRQALTDPNSNFTSGRQFLENVTGSTRYFTPDQTSKHELLLDKFNIQGGDRNRTFSSKRNNEFIKKFNKGTNLKPSDIAFELSPYTPKGSGKRPKSNKVTFSEFSSDPELYREALGSDYETYVDILNKSQNGNVAELRTGGRAKYQFGGGIGDLQRENLEIQDFKQNVQPLDVQKPSNDVAYFDQSLLEGMTITPPNANGTSQMNNAGAGDTPQYTTDPTQNPFEYNPDANITKPMRFNLDKNTPDYWGNDSKFQYTRENVQNELLNKGFSQAQVNKFFNTPGYAEQFFDNLAKNPDSNFSKSQFKNDGRFGPEHMMTLINNKDRLPGSDNTPLLQGKGFQLPTGQQIDLEAFKGGSGNAGDVGLEGGQGSGERGDLRGFGPDYLGSALSALPNLGLGLGNLNLANNLQFERTGAETYQPDYVDPTRAIQEVRDQYAGVKDVIRQSAGGSGNLMSNLIGATASQSKATSGVASQYDNINAGISNQAGQFNAQNRQRARDINAQIGNQEERLQTQLKQQAFENFADAGTTGLNTYFQSKRDAQNMNIAGGENFYYKQVGPAFSPKPVKVFRGNNYHYYEDPNSGALVYIDPETGQEIQKP